MTVSSSSEFTQQATLQALPHSTASRLGNFRLWVSERKLLLLAGDLFIINLALTTTLAAREMFVWSKLGDFDHFIWFIIFSCIWLGVGEIFRVYDLARSANPLEAVWATSISAALTSTIYLLIPFVTPGLPSRRADLLLLPLLTVAGVALWRLAYATLITQPRFQQTAIVVGAGHLGRAFSQTIDELGRENAKNPNNVVGYQILGFVDDDPAKQDAHVSGAPVLGNRSSLLSWIERLHPDQLVLAITDLNSIHPDLFAAILVCRSRGVAITTMPEIYEQLTGRVPVEYAGQDFRVAFGLRISSIHRLYAVLRRVIDICVGLIGCIGLLIIIPAISLINNSTFAA